MGEQRSEIADNVAAAETPRPTRGVWRYPRYALARYLRLLVRHRFVGCVLGLIVLMMVCGLTLSVSRLILPRDDSLAPLDEVDTNELGTLILAEEEGVSEYLSGMAEFDAERMWQAYADVAQSDLMSRGRSPDDLQRGLDQANQNGARIAEIRPLGSYPLRDGRRYVFYIVRRIGFPPDGGVEDLYFIFTVDPSGKILNVT